MLESSLSEQELAEVEAATPGSQLRSAREQAQLTVVAVAEELKLTAAYIESLECDDFEALPAEPFVLGYLRAYARLLGLDAQVLVENYHEYCRALLATAGHLSVNRVAAKLAVKPEQASSEASGDHGSQEKAAAKNYTGWIVAACLLLWAAASVLMPETSTSIPVTPATNTVDQAEIDVAPSVVDQSISEAAENVPLSEDTVTAELEVESVDAEPVELVVAEVANSPDARNHLAELDTLQLDFLDECWLEVTDSRGDVLNADLYQAGDSKTLQGKAPFDVMLGNVRAVSARLNDELLELNPNGFRKTLRLRINSTSDIDVISRRPSVDEE